MNWKGWGRERSWLNLGYYSRATGKPQKTQDSQYSN